MKIKDIRLNNFKALMAVFKTDSEFGEFVGMEPSQVSLIKTGRNNIGDRIAEKIELKFDKPVGWMDSVHDLVESTGTYTHQPQPNKISAMPTNNSVISYDIDQKRLEQAIDMVREDVGDDWCIDRKTTSQARLIMMAYDRVLKNESI